IDGNTFEDAWDGAVVIVEHNGHVRPSRGRVYASASITNNTFAATPPFLAAQARAGRTGAPVALTIGEPPSGDAGELLVTESGNRSRGGGSGRVRMATVNGRAVPDGRLSLPDATSGSAGRESLRR